MPHTGASALEVLFGTSAPLASSPLAARAASVGAVGAKQPTSPSAAAGALSSLSSSWSAPSPLRALVARAVAAASPKARAAPPTQQQLPFSPRWAAPATAPAPPASPSNPQPTPHPRPSLSLPPAPKRRPLAAAFRECERSWYREALVEAKSGDPAAMKRVAEMCSVGYGTPVDHDLADDWLDLAEMAEGGCGSDGCDDGVLPPPRPSVEEQGTARGTCSFDVDDERRGSGAEAAAAAQRHRAAALQAMGSLSLRSSDTTAVVAAAGGGAERASFSSSGGGQTANHEGAYSSMCSAQTLSGVGV